MMIEDDNDVGILISTLEVIYMLLILELLRKSFGLLNLVIYAEKRFPKIYFLVFYGNWIFFLIGY